jgi:hypothetical protein
MFETLKPNPNQMYGLQELKEARGKTIRDVEYGSIVTPEGYCHSEMIILHLTDGSSLSITPGSNIGNFLEDGTLKGLEPKDCSMDLMPKFYPPGTRSEQALTDKPKTHSERLQ